MFKRKLKVTFFTQWSWLKAILSMIPKTASLFSLLTIRAPAGLHLVTAGGHSSPEYPICPCFHFFFSWYVYRLNALIYLFQSVISHYLIFLTVRFDHLWQLMNCSAVLLWLLLVMSIFSVYDAGLGNPHPEFPSKKTKTNSKHKKQTTTKTPCLFHVYYTYILLCYAVHEETIWKHRHFFSLKLYMQFSVAAVKIRRLMLCVYTWMR